MPRLFLIPLIVLTLAACAQQQEPVVRIDPVTGERVYGD